MFYRVFIAAIQIPSCTEGKDFNFIFHQEIKKALFERILPLILTL